MTQTLHRVGKKTWSSGINWNHRFPLSGLWVKIINFLYGLWSGESGLQTWVFICRCLSNSKIKLSSTLADRVLLLLAESCVKWLNSAVFPGAYAAAMFLLISLFLPGSAHSAVLPHKSKLQKTWSITLGFGRHVWPLSLWFGSSFLPSPSFCLSLSYFFGPLPLVKLHFSLFILREKKSIVENRSCVVL